MRVTKAFMTVYTEEAGATVAWWVTVLGRTFDRRPMPNCHEWDLAENLVLQVIEADAKPVAQVALQVSDLDAERERIQAHGVALSEPSKVPGFATLMLSQACDPAGNSLSLLSGG